jgi:hypothetical protein
VSKALENLKRHLDSDNKKVNSEQRSILFTNLSQQLADPSKSVMLKLIQALPQVGVLPCCSAGTEPSSAVHGLCALSVSLSSLSLTLTHTHTHTHTHNPASLKGGAWTFYLRCMIKSKKY